ncbi:MAG: DNA gyrase subunit A [Patescibacteria group bacterium]|nr:DNA gyrase subunit A [Patescibacteria group bacterium]
MSEIQKREIKQELEESYLDYAMSVIISRALPDVRDGLKPVHRRILWDMWDSGLTHQAKFRKSANVIGQVLARYHPHGDAAVYEALVRMAQDFSLRYPLIEGQGNFGSIDGDSAAAYRYTEARLSKIAEEMMIDIEKETVDWMSNYDGTRNEPKVLPAKLPNLILNGAMGIAVGMATSIPPHNLKEVVDAIIYLIENPDANIEDLSKFILGPDFPTGGIIFDKKAIIESYKTGKGAIVCRAKTDIEERKNNQFNIVVTEIPYQVNKAELIKTIAELVQNKKIEGIRDLRDESDREGLRIVIELKSDAVPQKVLNQLYKHTDLQKNFNLNMIALAGGIEPQTFSLKDILVAYLEHRKEVIKRRTEFDLRKAKERVHILEGLHKALSVIDKIIATIKKSRDRADAHQNLVKIFKLTPIQADAILEMRLQTLAALERQKIEDELKEKRELIKELELILKNPKKILEIIKTELLELKNKYGDERRTKVIPHPLGEFNEEDLIPEEQNVITLSYSGYIKRILPTVFRGQKRGGKGVMASDISEEDFLTHIINANTHDNILFFTDRGRVFQTKVYEIPEGSRISKGKAIQNFLELNSQEKISALIAYDKNIDLNSHYLIMVTKNGIIKKTALSDFSNIRRTGIIAISLKNNDELKWVGLSTGKDELILVTEQGQSIRFREAQIRPMSRQASGIKAITLKKNDAVAGFDIIKQKDAKLLVVSSNGFAKQTSLKEYKIQNRGGSGIKTAKITSKTGILVSAHIISDQEELLAISQKGQIIKVSLKDIRLAQRQTQGVRIIKLRSGDKLAGVVVI